MAKDSPTFSPNPTTEKICGNPFRFSKENIPQTYLHFHPPLECATLGASQRSESIQSASLVGDLDENAATGREDT